MKISVIIPTYNRAHTILRAVNSVLNQSYQPFEIIVVDDGSNDTTNVVLEPLKNEIIVLSQSNKGVSAARNTGIENAKGDWIALLDSDDEWTPNALETQVEYFNAHPDIQIFQCEEIWIRNGIRVNPKQKFKKQSGWIFEQCLPLCIVSPSAVMFTKQLWSEMEGFDKSFRVCEDYDLWLRVARKYLIGLNKNIGLIKYGGHPDQLSTTFPVMDLERIRAIEKHLKDDSLKAELRYAALAEIIKKLEIVINGAKKRSRDVSKLESKLEKYNLEVKKLN
ncbi:MAG: glycosyltransferase [Calditrichaeota bacterium]|nr:MAG: glycosyltransferase [Calditrichota bacterium]MBL1203837.1 glycosyltransferase [Calditrichota bacterium]NOG43669.1 glycosyltransferase [Calditrichota bacterium]